MKNNVKKMLAFVLSLTLLMSLAACGGNKNTDNTSTSGTASDETYTWKLGCIYTISQDLNPETSRDSRGIALTEFKNEVEEKSGGRLKIELYTDSLLGGNQELWDAIKRGEIEMYYGQPMSTADPRFGIWNVPYLFQNNDEIVSLACTPDGPIYQMTADWMSEHGLYLGSVGFGSVRGLLNSKHEIHTPDDMKDLKMRVYQDSVVQAYWGSISNAVPVSFADLYTSLQTKAVDACEFAAINIPDYKYNETCKYYTDINWQWTCNSVLTINNSALNSLPEDLQEIVKEASLNLGTRQTELELKLLDRAYSELEAVGMEVYLLTDAERQMWIDAARALDDEFAEIVGEETYAEFNAVLTAAR